MKKVALTICITLGLAACASTGTECTKKTEPKQPAVIAQPVAQPMAQPTVQQVAQPGCQGATYTVSEPVEILYKNTTYRTVYEPKTYSSVSYVKKPYNCAEGSLCKQKINTQKVQ